MGASDPASSRNVFSKAGVRQRERERKRRSIAYSQRVQYLPEAILRREAGVHKIPWQIVPFIETAVVEQRKIVLHDEGNDIVAQTLLEEDESADTPVAVLKGVNTLEFIMKV